jgi:hypothetical protein
MGKTPDSVRRARHRIDWEAKTNRRICDLPILENIHDLYAVSMSSAGWFRDRIELVFPERTMGSRG